MLSKKDIRKKSWRKRLRVYKRKQLNPIMQDLQWPLLGLTWLIVLFLGYCGFYNLAMAEGRFDTRFDPLYRTIQLIVLESGDLGGFLSWQLNAARFLLPLLAAYTAVRALLTIFRYQWQLLRARFFRKHLVLCGLGERGLMLVQEFLNHGFQVVIIDIDGDNPMLEQIRRQGAVVLVGDAADTSMLGKARINRAKYLITVCADDGVNAEIALKACDMVRSYQDRVLTAYVHIYNLDLCNLLSGWSLAAVARFDSFRLELFNVPAAAARLMLNEYSPFEDEIQADAEQKRLVVVGLGKMGRSLIIQAAQTWWPNYVERGKKLKIVVIDREVNRKVELLRMQYPQFERICELDTRQIDTDDHEFESGKFLFNSEGSCVVGAVYICFDNDGHALISALKLNRKTGAYRVPIIVRMKRNTGLASLINSEYGSQDFNHIHTFSILDKTCSLEAILGGTHEIMARAIHDRYVLHQKTIGATPQANPSMVEWDELPEALKESNRHQASRIEDKLKAVGFHIQPLTDWDSAAFAFSQEDIEKMAEIEHERWCKERLKQGWTYHKSLKDIKKKTSPYLVPWNDLHEDIKELDRNTVKDLPAFLALAGLQICRKL